MADKEHVARLKSGVDIWNDWRRDNPDIRPDLGRADLNEADLRWTDLSGADLRWAHLNEARLHEANLSGADLLRAELHGAHLNETNFSGANLSMAELGWADLGAAHLNEANLRDADLRGANLSRADLGVADLSGADLRWAHFTEANLRGADLGRANLAQASLIKADLANADLTGCRIFGISAWKLNLEGAKQKSLVISDYGEPEITVDDIEIAQFIHLLMHNEKIGRVIDTITTKAVLILSSFTPERKKVINKLREELRRRDRTPIVFDFDKPDNKSITDTVKLLAQIVRYIIVDLSDPRSAPYELGIISGLNLKRTPLVPILLENQEHFSMFTDVLDEPWCTELIKYKDLQDLIENLDERVVKLAEDKVQALKPKS